MVGFFGSGTGAPKPLQNFSLQTLHKRQCQICPLDKIKGNKHPHMQPTGTNKPVFYILGPSPSVEDDRQDNHFTNQSGQYLRSLIPRDREKDIRWNNVVRTRTPEGRDPELMEMECCRPSVREDIERTKPPVVIGFGGSPLLWACNWTGVEKWRGRRMPLRIGSHTCWFYPMYHPTFILEKRYEEAALVGVFERDMRRIFEDAANPYLPEPNPMRMEEAFAGVESITSFQPGDLDRLAFLLRWATEQPATGIDYETNRIRPYTDEARILTAAVGTEELTFTFPFDHPGARWTNAQRKQVEEYWLLFLERSRRKYVHNLAFEMEWTAVKFGRKYLRASRWDCTQVQASIINEQVGKPKPGCQSLEFLVQQHFGFNLKDLSPLDKTALASEPLDVVLRYNGGDGKFHCMLGIEQAAILKAEGLGVVYERAIRRIPAAVLTQIKGVPVDQGEVKVLQDKYNDRIKSIETDIFQHDLAKKAAAMIGTQFNPYSHKHMDILLSGVMKEHPPSLNEEDLTKIGHPFLDSIIALRKANKRKSTYIDPLRTGSPDLWPDGLIHHTLNTTFAETGRSSADHLNVQNWIKRDQEGREVRKPIRPINKDELIVACDYKQIQVCNIAMESNDKNLVKALWDREDIHGEWAQRFAKEYPRRLDKHKGEKDPLDAFRTDVKNAWTFPLFFGCTADAASGYLDIPVHIVKPEYSRFWHKYPGVRGMQDRFVRMYEDKGYVAGLTGRRRHGPLSKNMIINSPIQADESEMVFDAMCRLSEKEQMIYQPNMEIHDDLTFILHRDEIERRAPVILDEMLTFDFPWINVSIAVEISIGRSWLKLHKAGAFYSDDWKRGETDIIIADDLWEKIYAD